VPRSIARCASGRRRRPPRYSLSSIARARLVSDHIPSGGCSPQIAYLAPKLIALLRGPKNAQRNEKNFVRRNSFDEGRLSRVTSSGGDGGLRMARCGRHVLADQPLHVIQRGDNREVVESIMAPGAVIRGAALAASPESITPTCCYGFRARELKLASRNDSLGITVTSYVSTGRSIGVVFRP
jgi:hypothetical protein